MTLPLLLPALVTRLETIADLGSVAASASLANAQQWDHEQMISPKALAFIATLQADHSSPILNAHQVQLSWTFGVLLSMFAPHRFGQDQLTRLEQLQLTIIEALSGFQLHPEVTPLVFTQSRHHYPEPGNPSLSSYSHREQPPINHSGHWQSVLSFQTQHHFAVPTHTSPSA